MTWSDAGYGLIFDGLDSKHVKGIDMVCQAVASALPQAVVVRLCIGQGYGQGGAEAESDHESKYLLRMQELFVGKAKELDRLVKSLQDRFLSANIGQGQSNAKRGKSGGAMVPSVKPSPRSMGEAANAGDLNDGVSLAPSHTSAAASAVPDVAPATPNGDEVWFDAESGGVVELSPFDVKALDEDMKKLYHKQLNYQHTCQVGEGERLDNTTLSTYLSIHHLNPPINLPYQPTFYYPLLPFLDQVREIEQALTKLLRIWTPDASGGVLKTAASVEAQRAAAAALAAIESERLGAGDEEEAIVTMVLGPGLGAEELTSTSPTTKRRGPSAARVEEDDEPVPDERDLAAILAHPSPALQAILIDAVAGVGGVNEGAEGEEEAVVYYEEYVARIWPAAEAGFRKAADVKAALDEAAAVEAAAALAAAEVTSPEETGISTPVPALTRRASIKGRSNRAHVAIADIAKNSSGSGSHSSLPPYGLFDIVLFGDEPERSVFAHVQALIPPPKISLADLAMILPSPQDYQVIHSRTHSHMPAYTPLYTLLISISHLTPPLHPLISTPHPGDPSPLPPHAPSCREELQPADDGGRLTRPLAGPVQRRARRTGD